LCGFKGIRVFWAEFHKVPIHHSLFNPSNGKCADMQTA
jgi:hypothetical protein